MNRTGARLAFVTALALAVLAGSAYWLGVAVEQQARPALAALANSGGHSDDYQRGWFSTKTHSYWPLTGATAAGNSDGAAPGSEPSLLRLRHTVYHGPLPLARPWPALAYVETVPELSSARGWQAQLSAVYGDQQPFRLSSQIKLTGSTDHRLSIAPLELDAASIAGVSVDGLRFAGATGSAQLGRNGRLFNAEFSAPSLFLTSGDSAIQLAGTTFELTRLDVRPPDDTAHYRFRLTLALREWRLASERLGPGRLSLTLTGLDPALLQAPPLALAQSPGLALLWTAQSLLQAGPRLTLRLQLDTPRGPLRVQGEALLQGVSILYLANPQALFRSLLRNAQGELVIGTELAGWLLPAARLARAREAGWLSFGQPDNAAVLRSRLRLDNGQLWLNDKAVR